MCVLGRMTGKQKLSNDSGAHPTCSISLVLSMVIALWPIVELRIGFSSVSQSIYFAFIAFLGS